MPQLRDENVTIAMQSVDTLGNRRLQLADGTQGTVEGAVTYSIQSVTDAGIRFYTRLVFGSGESLTADSTIVRADSTLWTVDGALAV